MKSKPTSWNCIKGCGACCKLDPSTRQEALAVLTEKQQEEFISLVGPDGWCIHYDKLKRSCNVYSQRPDFCHVSLLPSLFNIDNDQHDMFAIECCTQHIKSTYGGKSKVMRKFRRSLKQEKSRHG